jgi:hypothetical protein
MDYTAAVEIGCAGVALVSAVFGGMLKRSISQLDKKLEAHDLALQKRADDLAEFKLHCAETFVTSSALEKAIDRFSESINAVFKKLERIDEKLDGKADK